MSGENIPDIIDEYKVLRHITKNEHAALYEAVSTKKEDGNLRYIIKEFLGDDSHEEMDKEIRLTQMIENDSEISVSVPVLRRLGKSNYLLMQFRNNGRFLSDLLDDANMQLRSIHCIESAVNLMEGILFSLEVLHSFHNKEGVSGILHLDIHPGNIFYESFVSLSEGETGVVKFIDFSNAYAFNKSDNDVHAITCRYHDPKGFNVFSAPEITERSFSEISVATDLFSVAALFFYMITKKIYIPESDLDKEIEETGSELAIPSLMRFALKRFFHCGLAYNPFYRFHSAREMLEELQNLRKIIKSCKTFDYTEATSTAFELLVPVEEFCRIPMAYSYSHFFESVARLDRSLHINNVDIYRCNYQFEIYWSLVNEYWDNIPVNGKMIASLLRSGILCCNNTGYHTLGDTLRIDLEKYKEYLSVPEYLNLQLNLAEQENDKLEYIAASERVACTISCLEIIKHTYEECSKIMGQSEASAKTIELGRAYSANGRYLSFLCAEGTGSEKDMKAAEAELFFRKALDEFEGDVKNQEITICHILQLAVECNNKDLYNEFAPIYFGDLIDKDIESCLRSILTDKNIDVFKILILLKCLNQFLPDQIDKGILNILKEFVENIRKTGVYRSPFVPLIYRHIGIMMYRKACFMTEDIKNLFVDSITYFDNTSFENSSPLSIITVMAYQTWAIYNELVEIKSDNLTLRDMLVSQSRNNGWNTLADLVERGRSLTKLLRYEYA